VRFADGHRCDDNSFGFSTTIWSTCRFLDGGSVEARLESVSGFLVFVFGGIEDEAERRVMATADDLPINPHGILYVKDI